jgi:hypothetical protein
MAESQVAIAVLHFLKLFGIIDSAVTSYTELETVSLLDTYSVLFDEEDSGTSDEVRRLNDVISYVTEHSSSVVQPIRPDLLTGDSPDADELANLAIRIFQSAQFQSTSEFHEKWPLLTEFDRSILSPEGAENADAAPQLVDLGEIPSAVQTVADRWHALNATRAEAEALRADLEQKTAKGEEYEKQQSDHYQLQAKQNTQLQAELRRQNDENRKWIKENVPTASGEVLRQRKDQLGRDVEEKERQLEERRRQCGDLAQLRESVKEANQVAQQDQAVLRQLEGKTAEARDLANRRRSDFEQIKEKVAELRAKKSDLLHRIAQNLERLKYAKESGPAICEKREKILELRARREEMRRDLEIARAKVEKRDCLQLSAAVALQSSP